MVSGAILLSITTISLDSALPISTRQPTWFYAGGAEGAQTLLTMLAASMLTIFGIVFSIVIVALTLASSQFGPRMIRTFLSDTVDQIAVGTFISTFVYCLLVAKAVRSSSGQTFVPHLSVSVAILLVVLSLGVLIYFVNHLSISLQASYIIGTIGADLRRTIERELPERAATGLPVPPRQDMAAFASAIVPVASGQDGYIQAIDYRQLVEFAQRLNVVLQLNVCAGDFLVRNDEIATVSVTTSDDGDIAAAINSALVLGTDRTHEQDVEFPINQLVQLAVRALSPAINDPITAIMAIEQLGAGLCFIAERGSLPTMVADDNGQERLLVKRYGADHHVDAAFNLIRQYGRENLEGTVSLLEAIQNISRRTTDIAVRRALWHQATLVGNGARCCLPEQADRDRVAEVLLRVLERLP